MTAEFFTYYNITTLFDRGYTLHEHYDEFGLINMNGRVYDPYMSTFLSSDNLQKLPVGCVYSEKVVVMRL